MIKYLGSKRRLVPLLGELCDRAGVTTAIDLFTGTTRVAQEFKRRGAEVWAVDSARYAEIFARCYVQTDARSLDLEALEGALHELDSLPGHEGYVTRTFCNKARFFQPHNGRRIDAIRDAIRERYAGTPIEPILLTSLIEAADRVDSTTGVQMAYLKEWAPRSFRRMELRVPELLSGPGHALRGDAHELAAELREVDLAYLDPPYNQHRYFTNYHVWETLAAWDDPEPYGVACKRIDARDPSTKSAFNDRRRIGDALSEVVERVRARVVIVSFSDEGWLSLEDLTRICSTRGAVRVLAFDSRRYIGSQIGIFNPSGEKVGRVSHVRNTEYVLICGERSDVDAVAGRTPDYEPAP